MSTRYLTNMAMALLGGLVLVATQAFSVTVATDLAFAVGIALVAVAATVQLDPARGLAQRALDGATIVLGGWTIIASILFAAPLVTSLTIAESLGFIALAVIGLTLHEFRTERVVHALAPAREQRRPMARETSVAG